MKQIILSALIVMSAFRAMGQVEETKQVDNRTPFLGNEVTKDTINKLLTLSYPKNWQRDLSIESQLSPSYYYRCLKVEGKIIAYFQVHILYIDNPDVSEAARNTNLDFTGENGPIGTTAVDGRKAAYCFYKQTSDNRDNNFTIKHLFINADNKALITFKTQTPADQTKWGNKDIFQDIENSIKVLKE
jgi:hypothetical protein